MNKQAQEVHEANEKKGFWDDVNNIPQKMADTGAFTHDEITAVIKAFKGQRLMLVVSELAEAMEADRKDLKDDKLPQYDGFDVEIVDAHIRIMDMYGGYNIDAETIFKEKLAYNASRPYKHGKKY